jgi:hypothetical protein
MDGEQYRILWKIQATGKTGQAPAIYDREAAEEIAEELNAQFEDTTVYWAEPVLG